MIEDQYLPKPQKGVHHHRFKLQGMCANRGDGNLEYQYLCKCGVWKSELKSVVEMMLDSLQRDRKAESDRDKRVDAKE